MCARRLPFGHILTYCSSAGNLGILIQFTLLCMITAQLEWKFREHIWLYKTRLFCLVCSKWKCMCLIWNKCNEIARTIPCNGTEQSFRIFCFRINRDHIEATEAIKFRMAPISFRCNILSFHRATKDIHSVQFISNNTNLGADNTNPTEICVSNLRVS